MRVILFSDGLKGFGVAEVTAPSESDRPVYPADGYYHRTMNMDCRFGGAVPAWRVKYVGGNTNVDPVYCFNWRDNNDEPLVVFAGGTKPRRIQNGAATSETAFGAICTGGALWEDGSGNSVLIVGFDNAAVVSKRTTTADDWSATGDAKVGKIAAVGPDLYAQTDAGVFSSYKVAKCVAGNDPTDKSKWSAGERVGHPAWAINAIVDGGGYPVVGKPDGAFVWNNVDSRYDPILPFLENAPHPDNCKGMAAIAGGVFIPLADGSAWLFDGGSVRRVRESLSPNQDTVAALGRITAVVDTGSALYAPVATYVRKTQQVITSVKKDDGGSFTTDTNSYDGSRATSFDVGSLGNTTADWLYIGSSVPLVGIGVVMGTLNTNSDNFDQVNYYDGAAWQMKTISDTTKTATSKSFAKDGVLAMAPTGTYDPTAQSKTTVDGVEAYWLRFRITATGLSAGTTVLEFEAIPARPGLGLSVDHTAFDLAAAGIPHILTGVRSGAGIIWHDHLAVPLWGNITVACLSDILPAERLNTGPTLVLCSQDIGATLVSLGTVDNPLVIPGPALADATSSWEGESVLWPCRVRFPQRMRVNSFHIDVEHMDNADTLEVFMRWDQSPFFSAGTLKNSPGKIDVTAGGSGLSLEVAVAYDDVASTELFAPRIRRIEVEVEATGESFDAVPYLQERVPTVE